MPSTTAGVGVQLFRNGQVWTGGQAPRTVTALAVADGRVAALGAAAEDLAGTRAEVLDLEGGWLMPSFADGHAHPLLGGLEAQGPQVKGLTSVEAIAAEVGRWAAAHPATDWIVGGSYDPSLAPGGEFDARWLDAAVADRPVVLRAMDYHTAWCNTEALRRAGVTATTPDPELGRIVRRADGTPMGTLREWHAVDLVLDQVPGRPAGALVEAVAEAGRTYAAAGLTWVQDAWVEPDMIEPYLEAERRGLLRFRVNLAFHATPASWPEQRERFRSQRRHVAASSAGAVTARTVKFFADGVVEGGTAALLAPYLDDPDSRGMPVWTPTALADAVTAADADGFQVHIHALGDAAVRTALDAVEQARRVNGERDRRPVITHAQMVDAADLPRFARAGVVVNVEPYWAQLDPLQTALTIPRIGPARAAAQYPLAELLHSGAALSFGSDWPVSSHRPLDGIQIAVTRRTLDGDPPGGWTPHQRLRLDEALHAATAGVAWQAFAEHAWGSLAPGHSADLVWLAEDPTRLDPMALRTNQVRGTWLAGRPTFRA